MTIAFADGTASGFVSGNGFNTGALTGAVATNDLIVFAIYFDNYTNPVSVTVSDNVNSGNYSLLYYNTTNGFAWYYKACNAPGTPTITVSADASGHYNGAAWQYMHFNGFTEPPTFDSSTYNSTTGTGATVPSLSITPSQNPELILAMGWSGGNNGDWSYGGSWSGVGYGNAQNLMDPRYIVDTTEAMETWTGATQTSAAYYAAVAGFYNGGGTASIAWVA